MLQPHQLELLIKRWAESRPQEIRSIKGSERSQVWVLWRTVDPKEVEAEVAKLETLRKFTDEDIKVVLDFAKTANATQSFSDAVEIKISTLRSDVEKILASSQDLTVKEKP